MDIKGVYFFDQIGIKKCMEFYLDYSADLTAFPVTALQ